jgi:hypothetical protein
MPKSPETPSPLSEALARVAVDGERLFAELGVDIQADACMVTDEQRAVLQRVRQQTREASPQRGRARGLLFDTANRQSS